MKHSQLGSIFSCKCLVLPTIAVLSILASPGRSTAQDAGVSGIPPGPANARGLNGSISDPSGHRQRGKGGAAEAARSKAGSGAARIVAGGHPVGPGASHGQDQTNAICNIRIEARSWLGGRRGARQTARSQDDQHL